MKLRSMKTAPRTARILVWRDGDALPFIGYWGNPFAFRQSDDTRDAWIGHEYGLLNDRDVVGWLPLPERKRSQ